MYKIVTTEMIVEAFRECSVVERTDFLNQIAKYMSGEEVVMDSLASKELINMCREISDHYPLHFDASNVIIDLGSRRNIDERSKN